MESQRGDREMGRHVTVNGGVAGRHDAVDDDRSAGGQRSVQTDGQRRCGDPRDRGDTRAASWGPRAPSNNVDGRDVRSQSSGKRCLRGQEGRVRGQEGRRRGPRV